MVDISELDVTERIYLSYQDLYRGEIYDIDMDANDALREGLKQSFQEHDVLVSEIDSIEDHRNIFAHGVGLGVAQLQEKPLEEDQRKQIYQDVDFVALFDDFYDDFYNNYSKVYNGETVDINVDNSRYLNSIVNEEEPAIVDPKEQEMGAKTSGLSYRKSAPDVERVRDKQVVRDYETVSERKSRIEHEKVAQDMRDAESVYDKQYHDESKQHNPHKNFTAGDSYGFDEKDDGPEL